MKKWCRLLIVFALVLLMLPLAPIARAEVPPNREELLRELKAAIIESCTYNREIDIFSYQISTEELQELFYAMYDQGELPWYTLRDFFSVFDRETGMVKSFDPRLLADYKYDRATYQQRLEEILQACVLEGMADWQIALSIHDYLIVHTRYDESLRKTNGYELLTEGMTVCAGYTEVYRELMNMAGIPCKSVVSEKMNHTWNLVQIGGKWYHVDLTWDDPTPDCYGRVWHSNFLLTDLEIASGRDAHYGWETDIKCTDTTYSTAFWRSIENPILFTDPDTCYLIRADKLSNAVYKRSVATGKETRIYKEKSEFINIGKGSYRYLHQGLSLWNGRLWVGTMTKVLSMDLSGADVRTEFTYAAKKNKRYIGGFYVYNDQLHYLVRTHGGDELTDTEDLESSGYHVHAYTQTVVEPKCGEAGYTISECSCGIKCQSTPTYPLEHKFESAGRVEPTLTKDGVATERCAHCGLEETETIPKLTFRERFDNAAIGAIGGTLVGVIVVIFILIVRKFIRANAKNYPAPQTPPQELPPEELPQDESTQEELPQEEPPADTEAPKTETD